MTDVAIRPLSPRNFFAHRDSFFDLWFVMFMAGFACWVVSVPRIDVSAVHYFGLVDVFPVVFYVALALIVVSIVGELHSKSISKELLALQFIGLIVVLHATTPLLYPEPRYAWVYKHFGVAQYIDVHGSVNTNVDIYQNWPVFFALAAWLDRLAGVSSPVAYAEWAQLFFNLCYLVLLTFVYRSLTHNVRVIGLALLVFFLGSWVAQDYFAPQAFAFLIALAIYGTILRWLGTEDPRGPILRVVNRIFRPRSDGIRAPEQPPLWASTPAALRWGSVLLVLFGFVVAASHQLTPYLILAGVGLLTLLHFLRFRVLLILGLVTGFYLAIRVGYVLEHYGLFSSADPLANSRNSNIGANQGVAGRVITAQSARILSAVVIVLAVGGFFRRLRHGKSELVPAALMVAPIIIFFGQSYGGEAVYRVFLFALPWAAFLAAYLLEPITAKWNRVRFLSTSAVGLGLLALLMPAYYGLEELNQMRTEEVDAAGYFYSVAPENSVLFTIAPNFPLRAVAEYDKFAVGNGGDFAPSLVVEPEFRNPPLSAADIPRIEERLRSYEGTNGFVVLSPSQRIYTEVFEMLPPGTFDQLNAAFSASPNWSVFYRNGDTVIYALRR